MNDRSGSTTAIDNGGDYEARISERRKKITRKRSSLPRADQIPITATTPFLVLVALLGVALLIQFMIVFSWHHKRHDAHVLGKKSSSSKNDEYEQVMEISLVKDEELIKNPATAHLVPHLPPLSMAVVDPERSFILIYFLCVVVVVVIYTGWWWRRGSGKTCYVWRGRGRHL